MRNPTQSPHQLRLWHERRVRNEPSPLVALWLFASLLLSGCLVSRPVHEAAVAALNESRAEVVELRAQREQDREVLHAEVKAAGEVEEDTERAHVAKLLREQLTAEIEAKRLQVRTSRGRLIVDLPQDLLFPAQAERLGDIGEETIAAVAKTLASLADWSFRVEVHSDTSESGPAIANADSWSETAARAATLVQALVMGGVSPHRLSATGLGHFRPRADNRSEEGRTLNRRVEIIIDPQP